MHNNSSKLGNLADKVDDRENQIDGLNRQRDALLENYIKG